MWLTGVFGADEVKSVMEGDSVTLNPDLTQIQGFNQILWRFGSQGSIASIVGKDISYEDDEIFRDRLELDQTGNLTIKNMKTKHSGRYKAEINHSTGTLSTIFIVNVYGKHHIWSH
uniref:Immunoglobulin domain-containing protein n=1 Tax=Cyprinus carpio TaxID=7962 RepID=A0A8C1QSX5_CYPCA